MGAKIVEKHFTLNRMWPGDDHFHSVDSRLLKVMVNRIREVESAFGSEDLKCLDVEMEARKYARRSLVAKRIIKRGELITEDLLCAKRPGVGIPPNMLGNLLGRRAGRDILEDEVLTWDSIMEK